VSWGTSWGTLHPDAPSAPSRRVVGLLEAHDCWAEFHPDASGAARGIRAPRDPTTSDVLVGASPSLKLPGFSGGNVPYYSDLLAEVGHDFFFERVFGEYLALASRTPKPIFVLAGSGGGPSALLGAGRSSGRIF